MNNEVGATSAARSEPGSSGVMVFEQQPRESNKAFAAFKTYLELGPERSLAVTADKLGKSKRMMEKWSRRHDWAARLQAHAAHLAIVEREAIEAAARSKAAEWESREQQLLETEWEYHERAIAAAKRGLDAFMEREKVYANLADIARMLEIASKLGRLATGLGTDGERRRGDDLPTVRVEVNVALEKIYGNPLPEEVVNVEEVKTVTIQPSPGLRPPSPAPASEGQSRQEEKP